MCYDTEFKKRDPMMLAGNLKLVELLIEMRGNVSAMDQDGYTALHMACAVLTYADDEKSTTYRIIERLVAAIPPYIKTRCLDAKCRDLKPWHVRSATYQSSIFSDLLEVYICSIP